MPLNRRFKSIAVMLACATVGAILLTHPIRSNAAEAAKPTTGPTTVPTSHPSKKNKNAKSGSPLMDEYQGLMKKYEDVLARDEMSDATKRDAASPMAIPILNHELEVIAKMNADKKISPMSIDQFRQSASARLFLLNDQPMVDKVKEMKASTDVAQQLDGQAIELQSKFLSAPPDKDDSKDDSTTPFVDQVEALDKAHPDSERLTVLTFSVATGVHSDKQHDRLIDLIENVMDNPTATKLTPQIEQQKAMQAVMEKQMKKATAKMKAKYEGKPMAITGKTVNGKDFTTADWKGKVVLVDFWATWCGPCVAGLPEVKETYSKYHDKGLEILGVDNDQEAEDVTTFTAKKSMEWPQLFEPNSDDNIRFSPKTLQFGIMGIPTMFLIDKNGVCRSVEAREQMKDLIPKLLAE